MDSTLRGVYINVPQADMKFLKELVKKMGWTVERKESLLKNIYLSVRLRLICLMTILWRS